MTATQLYKTLSEADKEALKQLQTELSQRVATKVTLLDVLQAVTPGYETPAHLVGC